MCDAQELSVVGCNTSSVTTAVHTSGDTLHWGEVSVSDGKSEPQRVRLKLTSDSVVLQGGDGVFVPTNVHFPANNQHSPLATSTRTVCIHRDQESGELGIGVKGGLEHNLPILISKTNSDSQLQVGDAILSVNGESTVDINHKEAVDILKRSGGDIVWLTVQHHGLLAPLLTHTQQSLSQGSELHAGDSVREVRYDIVCIPLQYANITRYINNTDKLRANAFQVLGINSCDSGVIHCDSVTELSKWLKVISEMICEATFRGMQQANRSLNFIPPDTITYMGWCRERCRTATKLWHTWRNRFLCIKGADFCIFDSPPLSKSNWLNCNTSYTIYECVLCVLRETEYVDNHRNCFTIQSASPLDNIATTSSQLYFSMETTADLEALQTQWMRSVHTNVTALGSKTFSVMYNQCQSSFIIDIKNGFSMIDTGNSSKCFWTYKFSQLKGSSDDGKAEICLRFFNQDIGVVETQQFCTSHLKLLLYCMNSFLSAKLVSVDPNFLTC